MKYIFIVGGICQIIVAGFIAFGGYEPGIFAMTTAFLGSGVWLIDDND